MSDNTDLHSWASEFRRRRVQCFRRLLRVDETTRILDRNGNELYEVLDPNAGRRTYVSLENISPYATAATIATEDKEFYNHPGYDLTAMFRALWQNYTNQVIISGASTITQQLARTLLFSPLELGERTVHRKAREIVLAAEITRRYTKEEILELYLNEIYYGNMAYAEAIFSPGAILARAGGRSSSTQALTSSWNPWPAISSSISRMRSTLLAMSVFRSRWMRRAPMPASAARLT